MTFGPCGGVDPDGGCEVDRRRCPFLDRPLRTAPPSEGPATSGPATRRVVVDFRPSPGWSAGLDTDLADRYREAGDGTALLVGEHVDDTHGLGVAEHARRLRDRFGLPMLITLTGRNRTIREAERELDELAEVGVAAVHCVTGDHPAARFGPGHGADFGLDSQQLVALAAVRGLATTVAESPAAPPLEFRPLRILNKQRAGAGAVVLNHAGETGPLKHFARRCRDAGVTAPLIAPVPLVSDAESARRLARFPGLLLDPEVTSAVLNSPDPTAEGRRQAVACARRLLTEDGVDPGAFAGVNLSGVGPTDPLARADFIVGIVQELGPLDPSG
ncbi:MAG: methylenetetrahydrofolate reductase [Microthrixaceae bacterium]|nr:methylenetetrahydrofolate reductase [Microthrixaceae bacterium]